jgi:hypothetical protein
MPVVEWLLDSDPSIRWQALHDLTDAPADQVAAERARVVTEGWGARLLALRREDGLWDTGTPEPEWVSLLALLLLRDRTDARDRAPGYPPRPRGPLPAAVAVLPIWICFVPDRRTLNGEWCQRDSNPRFVLERG